MNCLVLNSLFSIANATEFAFKGGLGTVRGVSTTAGVFRCICFAVFVWTIKLDWFTYYRSFQRTHSQNKRQNTYFFALLLHIFHQMYAFLLTKYFYCLNALTIKSFLSNVYPTLQFKITILFVGFNSFHALFFVVADVHTLILYIC